MKTIVVGAGICGLVVARGLKAKGDEVVVLEKSKGVGGRLATRRTEFGKFDHGAQFYARTEALEEFHAKWFTSGISRFWCRDESSPSSESERFYAPQGMTDLAKSLLATEMGPLDVRLEQKVKLLQRKMRRTSGETFGTWDVEIEDGQPIPADRVVITAPLPQAIELLVNSQIDFPEDLRAVKYAKAIVLLIEGVFTEPESSQNFTYQESVSNEVYSISNQTSKGLSSKPSWTVVISPGASDRLFEKSDDEIRDECVAILKQVTGMVRFDQIQVKKWRYSHPLVPISHASFLELPGRLYLAGDGFHGGSIGRAVASGDSLVRHLTQ